MPRDGADLNRLTPKFVTENSMLQVHQNLRRLGYAVAQTNHMLSNEVLKVEEESLYPALYRLELDGAITSSWGTSENNRKAKFYSITRSGLKQLARETADWEQISGVIGRVLRLEGQK